MNVCKTVVSIILIMITIGFSLASCKKDDKANAGTEITLIIDSNHQAQYDASLVNPEDGSISFIKLNSEGNIDFLDIYRDDQSMMNVSFYENGLVKSFGNDEYAVVFSNYNGNKVDIAFICGDDLQMIKEYEGEIDWDRLVLNTSKAGTRSVDSDEDVYFPDWLRSVDGFLNKISKYAFVIKQAKEISNLAINAVKESASQIKKQLVKWIGSIHYDALDIALGNESIGLKIKDMGEVIVEGALLGGGPWGVFLSLVSNYPSYVDLCTEMWLSYFDWRDTRYKSNVDLGLAVLDSGSGDLKATLSWNFYADIDLIAIEPNGTAIFWKSPFSYFTGGFLDVDNREGGIGATENIYWNSPEEGTYVIGLNYYGPSTYNDIAQSGMCKVTILYKGRGKVYNISMTENDIKDVSEITLPSGTYTRAILSFCFDSKSLQEDKYAKQKNSLHND